MIKQEIQVVMVWPHTVVAAGYYKRFSGDTVASHPVYVERRDQR